MEACMLLMGVALAAAFGCAVAGALAAIWTLRRRRAVVAVQAEGAASLAGLAAWRLRNGFKSLAVPTGALLKIGRLWSFMEEASELLSRRGLDTAPQALLEVTIVVLGCAALAAGLLASSAIAAVAVVLCLAAAGAMAVGAARDRRAEAARDAVPEALESMSACFGSGFTLLQTLEQAAGDVEGPLGEAFARSAHILETGGGADAALAELRQGECADELAFVSVALDVQHQSGGAMRQVLDAAADTVKGELALRRSLRVQTAQAKLSARVVAIMPLVLVAAFSLISPDFLSPFFESAFGYALLGAAIAMQLAGIVLVRRALAVDGVS